MSSVSGIVKWFDVKKGYGFIKRDDGAGDVFLHAKNLEKSRFPGFPDDPPQEGDKLAFDIEQGPKGGFASNIVPAT